MAFTGHEDAGSRYDVVEHGQLDVGIGGDGTAKCRLYLCSVGGQTAVSE
jgi:hypothetical protein